jgi:hypothetical protein
MLELLRLLSPKTWAVIGFAALLTFSGVQSIRVAHAKHDLKTARVALVNPATGDSWQSEAMRDARDLRICRTNTDALKAAITRQNAAADALKAEADRRSRMLADGLQAARKTAATATAGCSEGAAQPITRA